MRRMRRLRWLAVSALFALIGSIGSAGCALVPQNRRAHLADPIMSFSPNPVSSVYLEHVYEAREGARGATGIVGGGCGCN